MADGGSCPFCMKDDERLVLMSKYGIAPGTTHYFPHGHESGLGGMVVYFPRRLSPEEERRDDQSGAETLQLIHEISKNIAAIADRVPPRVNWSASDEPGHGRTIFDLQLTRLGMLHQRLLDIEWLLALSCPVEDIRLWAESHLEMKSVKERFSPIKSRRRREILLSEQAQALPRARSSSSPDASPQGCVPPSPGDEQDNQEAPREKPLGSV